MIRKQKPNEKCVCNSGLKYKKCCSIKNNIKKFTCDKCDFERSEDVCITCDDIYRTRMDCEKQIEAKAFIFSKLSIKYGKQYDKFLASYNRIHGYSDNKESNVIFDMVVCSKCGCMEMMKRTRKKNVIKNRTCKACKGKTLSREEEIAKFIKETEDSMRIELEARGETLGESYII